jgi:hypothetical protein
MGADRPAPRSSASAAGPRPTPGTASARAAVVPPLFGSDPRSDTSAVTAAGGRERPRVERYGDGRVEVADAHGDERDR